MVLLALAHQCATLQKHIPTVSLGCVPRTRGGMAKSV